MLSTKRHSYAHVLAQAIKHIYGNDVKMAIGPDIENGFYYDFDFNGIEFSDKNLKEVEKHMQQIIKQGQKFVNFQLPTQEAINLLKDLNEPYKVEIAQELQDQ
jgi:threonyl-tRNA synthetase